MSSEKRIYLDWAATSFPKPETVYGAMLDFARNVGVGNDRGHGEETARVAELFRQTRAGIAALVGASRGNIVFSSGTTESLNTLLSGILREGDHVIISPFEHNSVLRPLQWLEKHRRIEVSRLPASRADGLEVAGLAALIRPKTRLCLINHVSNAFGFVSPLEKIAAVLRSRPGVFFAVDGAQSLGTCEIDVRALGIDFLAFSGHKGLLGPTGTGGFVIADRMVPALDPLKFGGTGFRSMDSAVAEGLPFKFEVGTQNSWGIAGLAAGIEFVRNRRVKVIHEQVQKLTREAAVRLGEIPAVTVYSPAAPRHHGVVSFNVADLPPEDTAALLDKTFGIKVRSGLHCAPEAHRFMGTVPRGTVRASFGVFSTPTEVEMLVQAVKELAESYVAEK